MGIILATVIVRIKLNHVYNVPNKVRTPWQVGRYEVWAACILQAPWENASRDYIMSLTLLRNKVG